MLVNEITSNRTNTLNFGSKKSEKQLEQKQNNSMTKAALTGLGILGSVGLALLLLKKGQGAKVLDNVQGAFIKTEDAANGKVLDDIIGRLISEPAAEKFIQSAKKGKAEIICDKIVRLKKGESPVRIITAKYPSGKIVSEGYLGLNVPRIKGKGRIYREIITPERRAYYTTSSNASECSFVIRNADGSGVIKQIYRKPEKVSKVVSRGYHTSSPANGMTKIANPDLEIEELILPKS